LSIKRMHRIAEEVSAMDDCCEEMTGCCEVGCC